jgi:FMN phosphatase YigB (HAD superfamily)
MPAPRAVLFDLDGTLLQHDVDLFMPRYIAAVVQAHRDALGLDVLPAMMNGVRRAVRGDGSRLMVDVYFESMCGELGHDRARLVAIYEACIAAHGPALRGDIAAHSAAREAVEVARARGHRVVCATHPVFPKVFTDLRVQWSGVELAAFDHITTLENARFGKPNPEYYREVASALGVAPGDCVMVGNDAAMDLVPAAKVGMRTVLIDGPYAVRNVEGFLPEHTVALDALPALLERL